MAPLSFFLLVLPCLLPSSASSQPLLSTTEQESVYLALESINPAIDWRSLYPDDLCLSGPHGVVCDLFPTTSSSSSSFVRHVSELNFGYISDFSPNPPCGPKPNLSAIPSFPFLRKLFFYRCFTGRPTILLPDSFWKVLSLSSPSLEEIVFIENPSLTGTLTGGGLGRFSRLKKLVLTGTALSGGIPPEIGNLHLLEQLVLSRSGFTGEIPRAIRACLALKNLDLSGNEITGSIPGEIGRLRELVKIDLSSNRISGIVPGELAKLQEVEFLDLSRNNLTGGVPVSLGKMGNLREVYLSWNENMGGRIPEEIWGNLRGIMGIGMAGLGLVGRIPASMGLSLEDVCYLSMGHNRLEGEVPEEFGRMELTAREIDLENNLLTGRIPFSSDFVDKIGGKLKLGGNPDLCWDDDVKAKMTTNGGFGLCYNNPNPRPAIFPFAAAAAAAEISSACLVSPLALLLTTFGVNFFLFFFTVLCY